MSPQNKLDPHTQTQQISIMTCLGFFYLCSYELSHLFSCDLVTDLHDLAYPYCARTSTRNVNMSTVEAGSTRNIFFCFLLFYAWHLTQKHFDIALVCVPGCAQQMDVDAVQEHDFSAINADGTLLI